MNGIYNMGASQLLAAHAHATRRDLTATVAMLDRAIQRYKSECAKCPFQPN